MSRKRILIVDDEPDMLENCQRVLGPAGYQCLITTDSREALALLESEHPDLLLTDLKMPGVDGLALLRHAHQADPHLPVVIFTAFATIESAVAAMREGAFDYLPKPFSAAQLTLAVERALAQRRLALENLYLQEQVKVQHDFDEIIGVSRPIKKVLGAVERVARTDTTVLLLGETGTGKCLVGRAIHNLSPRGEKTFVDVNCAALPAGLMESELFGHEKGAFTGALSRRVGRFELADGGTILLDEIGEIPGDLQVKLLRVLQEGEFERVGSSSTIKANVRVIAATNRDLETAVQEGRFRPDLYYRLSAFPIRLPPLRERAEDIPLLVKHFVGKYGARLGKRIDTIPQAVMDALLAYPWPGNVRELENVIERGVILSRSAQLELGEWPPKPVAVRGATRFPTLEELERDHIMAALELTGWRVSGGKGAAKLLGLKPTTLEARMKKLGITRRR